jgi:hypothetical protein
LAASTERSLVIKLDDVRSLSFNAGGSYTVER